MFNIYSLSLENNKYYVGRTTIDPNKRFIQHQQGNGAEWTKKYKPLKIIEQYTTTNIFEEDMLTKKYMLKHGIDNVRGGSYTKIKLDDWQIKSLNQEFQTANEICFICNQTGHFAYECSKSCKTENINNKYLDKFTTIEKINEELIIVKKIYETIIILQKEKSDLSFVTPEIIKKLKEFDIQNNNQEIEEHIQKIAELQIIVDNHKKLPMTRVSHNIMQTHQQISEHKNQIQLIIHRKNQHQIEYDNIKRKINNLYELYLSSNTYENLIITKLDFHVIKAHQLLKLYLEKTKQLNEIYSINNTDDIIIEVRLISLYEKELSFYL
jgi:predicted GIY-YIG superfamily endonuclease